MHILFTDFFALLFLDRRSSGSEFSSAFCSRSGMVTLLVSGAALDTKVGAPSLKRHLSAKARFVLTDSD